MELPALAETEAPSSTTRAAARELTVERVVLNDFDMAMNSLK
jgi:hypothetical protein